MRSIANQSPLYPSSADCSEQKNKALRLKTTPKTSPFSPTTIYV
jgi:hypothetical protein